MENKEKEKSFFNQHKKIILLSLGLILALETIWVFSFLKKNPEKTISSKPTVSEKPKQQIASLLLETAQNEVKVGEKLTVKINLDTKERQINGVDTVISYNPEFLEAQEKIENGDLFESLLISDVDNKKGIVNITASRLSKDEKTISGKGILAVVTFVARKEGETKIAIVFDEKDTTTSNIFEAKTSRNILTDVNETTVKISR